MRIGESEAPRAIHDRPFGHLIATEDVALHVAQIHDENSARREQQEINMESGTHPIGHQHVDQVIGAG